MQTKITNHEDVEQAALFRWAAFMESRYPELKLLFHVPNGGKRDKLTAAKLKTQGVKPGVPDIELPTARGGYFGLFIELKVGRNKTTVNQDKWLNELAEQGYKTAVCYGWEAASEVIEEYMKQVRTVEILSERRKNNET